jgi:hypothetical protein
MPENAYFCVPKIEPTINDIPQWELPNYFGKAVRTVPLPIMLLKP